MSFYECVEEAFQLEACVQKTIKQILYPNESQIWIFTENSIEVWNLDNKQRKYISDSTLPFDYKQCFSITYVNSKTVMIILQNREQKLFRLIKYDIESNKVNQVNTMDDHNQFPFVDIFYFTQNDNFNLKMQTYGREHYLSDSELKVYFKTQQNMYSQKYDDIGTICVYAPKFYRFNLMSQKQTLTFQLQGIKQNYFIIDVKRQSSLIAVINMSNYQNSLYIFYNVQTHTIIKIIQLPIDTWRIINFNGVWFAEAFDMIDSKPSSWFQYVQICDKTKMYEIIHNTWNDNCYRNTSTLTLVILDWMKKTKSKTFKRFKLKISHKYNLIHLLEDSGIVELFGNQIVKQVINQST